MNSVFDNTELKAKDPEITALLQQAVDQLKKARVYRQRSQTYMANKAGVTQKLVSHFESGKDFQFTTYLKLCLSLGLQPHITLKKPTAEALTWSQKNKQYLARQRADKGQKLEEGDHELL